ncbi:MAG: hypothetical protein J0I49_01100 [Pseudonocardia sp.]|uniref:hypothetical protein n=1 Tax=Pseudonocardia sp. TaxID=60912 RepID=UPI001ACF4436|nr:hypothetical protein [Pseudonocardia sp.]MBN9096705.1 hypothetical protein [Pseudonocardia sp.]
MGLVELHGNLGWVSSGAWEAIHSNWPAYPGDKSWQLALLRFGDFPPETDFTCLSIIDQCALFVASVGIKEPDPFSEKHMHVAVRLEELIELDDKDLVTGVEMDTSLSLDQMLMKRVLGPEEWEQFRSGRLVLSAKIEGELRRIPIPEGEEPLEEWEEDQIDLTYRNPEQVAMYPGTLIRLTPAAVPEVERVARLALEIPSSVENRVTPLLAANLFDSAIRDLGAALEMRMRTFVGSDGYGLPLVEKYIKALLASGDYLPARVKSLRQELRAIFKFIRNEFAHQLVELDESRGYALISRLCWHINDVELLICER